MNLKIVYHLILYGLLKAYKNSIRVCIYFQELTRTLKAGNSNNNQKISDKKPLEILLNGYKAREHHVTYFLMENSLIVCCFFFLAVFPRQTYFSFLLFSASKALATKNQNQTYT